MITTRENRHWPKIESAIRNHEGGVTGFARALADAHTAPGTRIYPALVFRWITNRRIPPAHVQSVARVLKGITPKEIAPDLY